MAFVRRAAALIGAFSLAGAASAQDADGWRQARPDDFVDTPHAAARAAMAGSALSASGDFDANGARDAARLMVNVRLRVYGVMVDLRTREGESATVLLATAPLHQLVAAGLDVARGRPDQLVIFTFDGARQFVRLDDGRVRTRWD